MSSDAMINKVILSKKEHKIVAFGDPLFTFAVYIANQPQMPEYECLSRIAPLSVGQVDSIGKACGNGWRKIFNVYAKLLYALDTTYFHFSSMAPTWQQYRDQYLLQENSQTALLFTPPKLTIDKPSHLIHIICGRTYAKKLINEGKLSSALLWLNEEFAVDVQQNVVVCPYFDYRQLSNIKIQYLSDILKQLKKGEEITAIV